MEQQGKTAEEFDALWDPAFWEEIQQTIEPIEILIDSFNAMVAVDQ